jgi:hypothetical protein
MGALLGDGAPFSFRPWRNTLLRRTAGTAETKKGIVDAVS